MSFTPALLPRLIEAVAETLETHSEAVTALDQAIGDGDHLINLQRGINALMEQRESLTQLDWVTSWQKIGMILMTKVGGASGSLLGTLFLSLSKNAGVQELNSQNFANIFSSAVESVKLRGKSDVGEKTLLDVLVPVADYLQSATRTNTDLAEILDNVSTVAIKGMEATRDMIATRGRASFLEERSRGHIDAGAKTSQLMICAVVQVLSRL